MELTGEILLAPFFISQEVETNGRIFDPFAEKSGG